MNQLPARGETIATDNHPVPKPIPEVAPIKAAAGDQVECNSPPLASPPLTQLQITLGNNPTPFPFFHPDTKLARSVALECLTGHAYPLIPYLDDVRTILDIGANVGAATLFFAGNYPNAHIHAFEPHPYAYSILSQNTRSLDPALISTYDYGLHNRTEPHILYAGALDSCQASIFKSSQSPAPGPIIQLRPAGQVLNDILPHAHLHRIDIIKIDTEGCEPAIIGSLHPYLAAIRALFIEFHHETARRRLDAILKYTHSLALAQISEPHRGTLCYIRRDQIPINLANRSIDQF